MIVHIIQLIQMGGLLFDSVKLQGCKPIYEQIKDGLRKLVITNSLIANEKLPSVREMASKLAINPNTIQKAYRELEAEGYVYTVAGKGTFVAERKEVLGVRNEELMKEFDEVVTELLFLAMDEDSLKTRIEQLAKGGEAQ